MQRSIAAKKNKERKALLEDKPETKKSSPSCFEVENPVKFKFYEWCNNYGVNEIAKHLKCHPHTVRAWMRGENSPRGFTLLKLVELSQGKLSATRILYEIGCRQAQSQMKNYGTEV